MLSNEEIIKQFYGIKSDNSGHKGISESGLRNQKDEDETNRGFFAGDRAEYTYEMSTENKKFAVCFNRVRPYVHSFAGFAAQNRRTPEYFAIEKDDQQREMYTETASTMLSWMRSTANADQIETAQDLQLSICGYGAVAATEDYMRNPDGEIAMVECTRDYWWDPASCQPGMGDRRWEYLRKKVHIKVALKKFGGKEADYEEAEPTDFGPYEYWPEGGAYDKIAFDWVGTQEEGMVYVYEYHWYDLEEYYRIVNPLYEEQYQLDGRAQAMLSSLDTMKSIRLMENEKLPEDEQDVEDLFTFDPRAKIWALTKEQYEDVSAVLEQLGIECDYDINLRKVFCEAVLSGNKVFKKRKSVDQSGFSVKVKTADYYEKDKIWIGMVSSLRDPAKFANAAITKFLLILASTSGPGYFYNISLIPDVAKFESQATKNAKAIGVNGDPNVAVKDKQQAALPNGYDVLYPMFLSALSEVIGFAPEALGMGDLSQPSFELEQQRIKQVMTTLAVYFDAITLYQKEHARSMLYFMRRLARNNEGRAIPRVDGDGTKTIAEIYSSMIADEYAIDIGEAPDTPSKRKEQGIVMSNFADKVAVVNPGLAQPVYALAVDYLPISASDKAKWRKLLTPQQDPAAEQKKAEIEEIKKADAMAEIKKKEADVVLKGAQAQKTAAETRKADSEAEQNDMENLMIATHPVAQVNVTI